MDISLVLKIAGTGLLVSVICQILSKSGRDEQAMLVTLAGLIVAMLAMISEIKNLFDVVKNTFGF